MTKHHCCLQQCPEEGFLANLAIFSLSHGRAGAWHGVHPAGQGCWCPLVMATQSQADRQRLPWNEECWSRRAVAHGLKEEMMLGSCWGRLDLPGESPQQAGYPPRLSLGLHFEIKTATEQQEL